MGVLGVKTTQYASILISAAFAVTGILSVNACSAPPSVDIAECAPNPFEVDPSCRAAADAGTDADASTDAESDADLDGSALKEDPGLQPSVFPTCKGACVPEASGATAVDWTWVPLVVWFGSKSEVDLKTCPPEIPSLKVRGYNKLVAPPAKCDACTCSANGSCNGLPASIEIRSGSCNASNVQTTPFDGPTNWNGSCTSINSMPAGKLCNGVPCAQSASASTLPGPTNESCLPKTEKPNATLENHEWLEGALACNAADLTGTCAGASEHCITPLPEGWLHCLARTGKHDVCPDNYNDSGARWVYQDNPIDDRGCSACECGTPKDGICTGFLSVYSDNTCINEFAKMPLSSIDSNCVGITPAGSAVGSKTISNLSYLPGSCSVTGGEPIGTVTPNDDEKSVVTICCRAPGPSPLPPLR